VLGRGLRVVDSKGCKSWDGQNIVRKRKRRLGVWGDSVAIINLRTRIQEKDPEEESGTPKLPRLEIRLAYRK
jgi:hypothetical protein